MQLIDLHIHTTASDGRLSPAEIVIAAEKAGLTHIAITDHDTINGLTALKDTRKFANSKISVIPGIELSTDILHSEVHILGYYIDIDNAALKQRLDYIAEERRKRVNKILVKLNNMGYKINLKQIMTAVGKNNTSIGRPHVARVLVEQGYFSTVSDVFSQLLNNDGPAYVPHYKLELSEIVNLIKMAGGISILAHPGLIGNDNLVVDILKTGILGMEVYHPEHNPVQTEKYLTLAKKYRLIVTGGSDFHGIAGRFPEQLGVFKVPSYLLNNLQAMLA